PFPDSHANSMPTCCHRKAKETASTRLGVGHRAIPASYFLLSFTALRAMARSVIRRAPLTNRGKFMKIKCALVGSRYFGAEVFETLRKEEGVEITCVVAPSEDDRLALAAKAAGMS